MDSIAVRKVLIVEDDLIVGKTLGLILTGEKYEVRVVSSAELAAALLATWIPDVAIVDVLLPGMNGVDFAILLESAAPDCHVLLFTALTGLIGIVEEARMDGHSFEVIEKPAPPLFMVNRVASLLSSGPHSPLALGA